MNEAGAVELELPRSWGAHDAFDPVDLSVVWLAMRAWAVEMGDHSVYVRI